MKRRDFLVGLASVTTLVATVDSALAASYTEDVVAQLVKLGFSDITASTTLLGRVRILATRADGVREIILNPRTGEILRDTWISSLTDGAPRTVLNDVDDGQDDGSGRNGDDSDDSGDDSGGDDSGDDSGGDDSGGGDDNSGRGGADDDNSGSGGGGDDKSDDRDGRDGGGDRKDD